MQISEKELEDFIYDDLRKCDGYNLNARGLTTVASSFFNSGVSKSWMWFRQVDLAPYGICDIVGCSRVADKIVVELFELKIVDLESDDIDQLLRYKKAIDDIFGSRFNLKIRCYLIGTGIKDGHYIHNEVPNLDLVEFTYGLSGIGFSQHSGGWSRGKNNPSKATKLFKDAKKIHGY